MHSHLSATWRDHSKTFQQQEGGGRPASADFMVATIKGAGATLSNTAYHLDPTPSQGIWAITSLFCRAHGCYSLHPSNKNLDPCLNPWPCSKRYKFT